MKKPRYTSAQTAPDGIRDILNYDPETGLFTHRSLPEHTLRFGKVRVGDVAGARRPDGYVILRINGQRYRAHRIAWYLMTGEWLPPSQDIDHINGDPSDNRWCNLRPATRTQNNMNIPLRVDNKSGHKGVFQRKDTLKWAARITIRRKIILLGHYDSMEDAVAARRSAEERLFGERSFAARGMQQKSL